MLNEDLPKLTLADGFGGAIEEAFQEELKLVLANCLDPNTEWKGKRKITIEVAVEPNSERNECHVTVVTKSKLAPFKGTGGTVFVTRRRGEPVAHVYDPKQLQLALEAQDRPRSIDDAPDMKSRAAGQ